MYDDLLALKKKPALLIEGDNTITEIEIPIVVSVDIPNGFFTFGYLAMKYLVVKAYKG